MNFTDDELAVIQLALSDYIKAEKREYNNAKSNYLLQIIRRNIYRAERIEDRILDEMGNRNDDNLNQEYDNKVRASLNARGYGNIY
jgi:hypothetical protein